MKRKSAGTIAGGISPLLRLFSGALLASLLAVAAGAQSVAPKVESRPGDVPRQTLPPPAPAPAPVTPPSVATPAPMPQPQTVDCRTLMERLGKLMAFYKDAAANDLNKRSLNEAMDRARNQALAGKKEATVVMVGYTSLVSSREGSYPISVVRQVCTFAERNGLPLHVATCGYFHVLNPLGEADARASAARKMIAKFEAGKEQPADLAEHVSVLKACLPTKP